MENVYAVKASNWKLMGIPVWCDSRVVDMSLSIFSVKEPVVNIDHDRFYVCHYYNFERYEWSIEILGIIKIKFVRWLFVFA